MKEEISVNNYDLEEGLENLSLLSENPQNTYYVCLEVLSKSV